MHRLRSPYTVQFHEWFETSNHLWLILEYCPGSRLMDLIQVYFLIPRNNAQATESPAERDGDRSLLSLKSCMFALGRSSLRVVRSWPSLTETLPAARASFSSPTSTPVSPCPHPPSAHPSPPTLPPRAAAHPTLHGGARPPPAQADLKLPEANVRVLGLNLLAALQVPPPARHAQGRRADRTIYGPGSGGGGGARAGSARPPRPPRRSPAGGRARRRRGGAGVGGVCVGGSFCTGTGSCTGT
jgi:hypothetical protein